MIWQSNAPYKFRYKVNVNFPNIQLFHYQNKKSQVFLLVIDYSVFNELQVHVIVRFAVIC